MRIIERIETGEAIGQPGNVVGEVGEYAGIPNWYRVSVWIRDDEGALDRTHDLVERTQVGGRREARRTLLEMVRKQERKGM